MRLAVVFLAALFAGLASAATVPLDITHPTRDVNGGTLPASGAGSLTGFRSEWGSCNGTAFNVKAGETVTAAAVAPATRTVANLTLGPGAYCIRVYARVSGVATPFVESAPTNAAQVTVESTAPVPPTFTVGPVVAFQIEMPVFKILADGSRSSAIAGSVKVGTACLGEPVFTYRGKVYRRVDPDHVRWWATTKTPDVAAPCVGA